MLSTNNYSIQWFFCYQFFLCHWIEWLNGLCRATFVQSFSLFWVDVQSDPVRFVGTNTTVAPPQTTTRNSSPSVSLTIYLLLLPLLATNYIKTGWTFSKIISVQCAITSFNRLLVSFSVMLYICWSTMGLKTLGSKIYEIIF